MGTRIDPRASVHAEAQLGADVEIGPGAVIERGVRLGDGVRVLANAVIIEGTRLGAGVCVHPGAVIGGPPQDAKYEGERSFVEIGAGTIVRELVTIHRGTGEGTLTRVGRRCMLMAGAHVAHNCTLGDDVTLANGALLGGHVEVGDRAFISGHTAVHQFCRIGRLAMLGGGASISQDLPPFVIGTSMKGNRVCGLNVVGLRRAGLGREVRRALKEAYQRLFRSETPLEQTLAALEAHPVAEVRELVAFFRGTRRGVIRVHEGPHGERAGGRAIDTA